MRYETETENKDLGLRLIWWMVKLANQSDSDHAEFDYVDPVVPQPQKVHATFMAHPYYNMLGGKRARACDVND